MSTSVQRIWDDYRAIAGIPKELPLPPSWHFCDSQPDADECAELVLTGRKRATAPSLWGLLHRGEPVPVVGALDIVTTWNGDARAIIRTTRVEVVPFHSVSAEHAEAEGEGDRTLDWWRRTHRDYYARELANTSYSPTSDMPIVCQYFEVVHPQRIPMAKL